MSFRTFFASALMVLVLTTPGAPGTAQGDGIARLLTALEQALMSGEPTRYVALLSVVADQRAGRAFAEASIVPDITRAVVRERDRTPLVGALPGDGYVLMLEVFLESGNRGWLGTWRVEARRRGGSAGTEDIWDIGAQESLNTLSGLYRLALDPTRQFEAKNLLVTSEDLELRLARGTVFVADAGTGPTAMVLLGDGQMVFRPKPPTEREQLKIYSGSETLETAFRQVFLRLNPASFDYHVTRQALTSRPVQARELQKANEVFAEYVGKSFTLNLTDLSSDTWALVPSPGDFLAEIDTKRFKNLTYARSSNEAEDITLFDRRRRRNISLYASERKLAAYGRSYDEDALASYDVLRYEIDARFTPDRRWIEGRTALTVTIKAPSLATLNLRLAESLTVRSVVAHEYGRLLAVPVRNQNSLVVSLPGFLTEGTTFTMEVAYEGRLDPQEIDREAILPQQEAQVTEFDPVPLEVNYLYSNRSYWYPQAPVSDYATAGIRITVPAGYRCVASGEPVSADPVPDPNGGSRPVATTFQFEAAQPARYLSFLVSRFIEVESTVIRAADGREDGSPDSFRPGVAYDGLSLTVQSNPRHQGRSRQIARSTTEIMRFYSSLVGRWPYSSLTVAVVERQLPGGHSPPYLAAVSLPVVGSRFDWRRDPAAFEDYPDFFLAHELAHQWWGQAVGWKNYHEQWLSEGLAQYFAALYAAESRGPDVFAGILRRLYKWGMDESEEGPISLGYRVGHIKGDSRLFRAVVYNKSAAVLHMLRRLIGDEAFFGGLRRFFETWRFRKAGTEDLRKAFEEASSRSLERFFERWVYESVLPTVKFSSKTEQGPSGQEVVVRFEQQGPVFDFPMTVTIEREDRSTHDVVVPVTDRVVEHRIPFEGKLRRVRVNEDQATLVRLR